MSVMNPITLSHASYGRAAIVPSSFVTAGTGVDPTTWDGAIRGVQILETASGIEFYRVTLDGFYKGVHVSLPSAQLLLETDVLVVMVGDQVADPALAITDRQFDITVRNAGAIDVSAGRKIDLSVITKHA